MSTFQGLSIGDIKLDKTTLVLVLGSTQLEGRETDLHIASFSICDT